MTSYSGFFILTFLIKMSANKRFKKRESLKMNLYAEQHIKKDENVKKVNFI